MFETALMEMQEARKIESKNMIEVLRGMLICIVNGEKNGEVPCARFSLEFIHEAATI